jgi:hypothetical protein
MRQDLSKNDRARGNTTADGWRTSSFCGPNGGNCVQVNPDVSGMIGIRDSKPTVSPVLTFAATAWQLFLADARQGGPSWAGGAD